MSLDFLQDGEHLLSSDKCRYHAGPLAFSGNIYITDKRLVFIPNSSIDKMAGAKKVDIEILDRDNPVFLYRNILTKFLSFLKRSK